MTWCFAQLHKRLCLYLSSDNTTRFRSFDFRKVFLIVIAKRFLCCMVSVLSFGDSNYTYITTFLPVFYVCNFPLCLFNASDLVFILVILSSLFLFCVFFTVPILPSVPSNFIFTSWSLVDFFPLPISFLNSISSHFIFTRYPTTIFLISCIAALWFLCENAQRRWLHSSLQFCRVGATFFYWMSSILW